MHYNLFTTCTSSSTTTAVPALNGKTLKPFATHADMLDYWNKTIKLQENNRLVTASQLYVGVSFRAAQAIKNKLEAQGNTVDLYVMSIGYGLIEPDEKIHPYNLSLIYDMNENSASMYRLIEHEKLNMELWWSRINETHGKPGDAIFNAMNSNPEAFNIICTSGTFLSMVAGDLLKAHAANLKMVIFGPTISTQFVRASRKLNDGGVIISVDKNKLDNKIPGNKFDQPQRAGLFLTECLKNGSFEDARKLMQPVIAVAGINAPKITKATQEEMRKLVLNAKAEGKDIKDVHRKLLQDGYIISNKALQFIWDPELEKAVVEKSDSEAALKALKSIGFITPDNEEESFELLAIFKQAMIDGGFGGSLFGAKEAAVWARNYCESVDIPVPGKFVTPQKLTHFIKNVGASLNIYSAETSKLGTAQFQLVTVEDDKDV